MCGQILSGKHFGIVPTTIGHVIGAGTVDAYIGLRSNEVHHAAATWLPLPISLGLEEGL